ncbi:MAG: hypothetical protein MH252_16665 [Thermosynechococcaceae cyanobacterium MS004]|nr:hypothetical protein [Thermosynechococcaceae cyanobacterium MS004]
MLWRSLPEGNSDASITIWCGYNLVRHGLVGVPKDWEYSSFHKSGREGKYGVMWGADTSLEFEDGPERFVVGYGFRASTQPSITEKIYDCLCLEVLNATL